MFVFLRKLIRRYPNKSHRALEILPGLVSWSLILLPVWGSFLWPLGLAYFIIIFDIYWLYRSTTMAVFAMMSHFRIEANKKYDWMGDVKGFGDWKTVYHVVVIPTYKEPITTLERTLKAMASQTLSPKQIIPVVAFEERAGKEINEARREMLEKKFGDKFAKLIFSYHPANIRGEVVGKSSNAAWGAKTFLKEMKKQKDWQMDKMTISSVDCDVVLHPNHMAVLTYKFLDSPRRYRTIWQGAIMFYNNIEKIPWPMRVYGRIASVINMGMLMRPDRLINFSTYSLSLKLMDEVGYWDSDVIPEDYRIFFKTYFATGGEVEVEPIFLPIFADAAEAVGFWNTFVNTYEQVKRWAWGASDDVYIIKNYILDKKAPFWDKTIRVFKVLEDHMLWPVNWFIITLGATLPPLLNDKFSRTVIGKTLPQVASAILTLSLVSLLAIMVVDFKARPKVEGLSWWRKVLSPFEFVLLPVVGFFFAAIPGIDAHTRLMLGKYLEYRVTEKV
ncbi:glycosyltransferase family 2 protein [Patescibacteria group bacterium]|nr:glycosyltransferase family 2 protein [Patescibacteria group bacterium]